MQQQVQALSAQKYQLEMELTEINHTIEELGKIKDNTKLYKSIGSVLVSVEDKDEVLSELKEHQESIEVRLKAMGKQLDALTNKYDEMQEKLNTDLQNMAG